jgi:hypothetical protein
MTSEPREPSVEEPVNGNMGNRKWRWAQRLDRTCVYFERVVALKSNETHSGSAARHSHRKHDHCTACGKLCCVLARRRSSRQLRGKQQGAHGRLERGPEDASLRLRCGCLSSFSIWILRRLHPAVVSIFIGALNLELARRHNDQKVLALVTKMCDMMSVIALYALIHVPPRKISEYRIG